MSRLTDQSLNRFIRLTGFVSSPSPESKDSPFNRFIKSESRVRVRGGWNPSLSSWDGNPTTSSCDCDWGAVYVGPKSRAESDGPESESGSSGSGVWSLGTIKKSSYFCTMLDDFEGGPDSNKHKNGFALD